MPLAEYFTGYRQTVRRPDELIKTIRIPLPVAPISAFHKIAKRRFDDISSVAVGFALRLDADGRSPVVATSRSGSAGVAATPLRALRTEAFAGRPALDPRSRRRRRPQVLADEGTPIERSPGQRGLPHRDARRIAAQVPRREHGNPPSRGSGGLRHEQGTRPAGRPAEQPQGRPGDLRTRAPPCTSPARRSTPTTWSTGPRMCCTPGRVQAPHAHAADHPAARRPRLHGARASSRC